MHVKASIKPRCNSCKLLRRKGRVYVVCTKKPRHKQRQG